MIIFFIDSSYNIVPNTIKQNNLSSITQQNLSSNSTCTNDFSTITEITNNQEKCYTNLQSSASTSSNDYSLASILSEHIISNESSLNHVQSYPSTLTNSNYFPSTIPDFTIDQNKSVSLLTSPNPTIIQDSNTMQPLLPMNGESSCTGSQVLF